MVKMPQGSNPAIVNIASSASIFHFPLMFTYGATKAAVAHFSICVGSDVKRFGIHCNAVSPGKTFTLYQDMEKLCSYVLQLADRA
jgi:short-subunit dehydrogenase